MKSLPVVLLLTILASNALASSDVRCARIVYFNGQTARTAPFISQNGQIFATVEPGNRLTIRRVDLKASMEGQWVQVATDVPDNQLPAGFSTDNRYLLSIHSHAAGATIRRVSDLQIVKEVSSPNPEAGSGFSLVGDQPLLVRLDSDPARVAVWDISRPQEAPLFFYLPDDTDTTATLRSFEGFLTASQKDVVRLWNFSPGVSQPEWLSLTPSGPIVPGFSGQLEFGTNVYESAISPNGELLALSGFPQSMRVTDNRVAIVEAASGKTLRILQFPGTSTLDIRFSPNGRYLAIAVDIQPLGQSQLSGLHVFIYDLANGGYAYELDSPIALVRSTILAVSSGFGPGGESYFLSLSDGTLYSWDIPNSLP